MEPQLGLPDPSTSVFGDAVFGIRAPRPVTPRVPGRMTTGPRLSRARSIRGGNAGALKMTEQERAARLSEVRPVRSPTARVPVESQGNPRGIAPAASTARPRREHAATFPSNSRRSSHTPPRKSPRREDVSGDGSRSPNLPLTLSPPPFFSPVQVGSSMRKFYNDTIGEEEECREKKSCSPPESGRG